MCRKPFPGSPHRTATKAFTLIELFMAATILLAILAIVLSAITQMSNALLSSTAKIDSFQNARSAFDLLTRNLSQATLNSYLDYDDPSNPITYWRKSELKFYSGRAGNGIDFPGTTNTGCICFFVTPTGYTLNVAKYGAAESLLNVCGYFIGFCTNNATPAHVSTNTYRYRLMQLLVPTELNEIYTGTGCTWFTDQTKAAAPNETPLYVPVADNIIALILRPQDSDPSVANPDLTTDYTYDSTLNAQNTPQPATANQLPPLVQVTMIAIDEVSAKRMQNGAAQPAVIANALNGKFFETSKYSDDLSKLEKALIAAKIQYRIFSSAVPLRESKWSK